MFLYYVPGESKITRASLRAHPIGDVIWDVLKTDVLFQTRVVQCFVRANGPDGSSGLLLIVAPTGGLPESFPIGYFPNKQTWIRTATHWVGHPNGDLPRPETLRREFVLFGEEHTLGDGNVWECPIIRRKGTIDLPSRWGVDPMTGEFQSIILAEYRDAWEIAKKGWDLLAGRIEVKYSEALEMCVESLSLNYRIGTVEASLLGLLDDTNYQLVIGAIIDQAFLLEAIANEADQKKS